MGRDPNEQAQQGEAEEAVAWGEKLKDPTAWTSALVSAEEAPSLE
jgi:hypothetical protein